MAPFYSSTVNLRSVKTLGWSLIPLRSHIPAVMCQCGIRAHRGSVACSDSLLFLCMQELKAGGVIKVNEARSGGKSPVCVCV